MSRAWVYQDDKQVKKHGPERASWYAGWLDPAGRRRCKSCGPGARGRKAAEQHARKVEGQLLAGTYEDNRRKSWKEFRAAYDEKVLPGLGAANRAETELALKHFERIARPQRMQAITSLTVAAYVAERRLERGLKPGTTVSPATVNKELRHQRAVLRKAHRWGHLPRLPDFEFLKEPGRLPTYVTPEHFAKLYAACDAMRWPAGYPFAPADWWRCLLMTAYMTGWRIGQILALRRQDVDLDAGRALSRAADNKGKRDQLLPLHPVVIEHMRRLASFEGTVLPWDRNRRRLFEEFDALQKAAGVAPPGKDRYGFHDLRRAFATMNADRLTADALQALMQHKDYQTTQKYINLARQLNPAVGNLFVPEVPPLREAR
jgi:integrase